jgi:hypothetical protein
VDELGELEMEQTFDEFINYCYSRILSRTSDPEGKEYYIKLLNEGVSKQ